jgi:rhamnulokinase
VPAHLVRGVPVEPGRDLGQLRSASGGQVGAEGTRIVAPATHDTASAVIGVPALDAASAYLSCGTWSLVGLELPAPVLSDVAFRANLSNERGIGGTTRLLRNVMGLWLLAESRRQWADGAAPPTWDRLLAEAEASAPWALLFDPDDPSLLDPGDLPARICALAGRGTRDLPRGNLVRAILECLALNTRFVLELLAQATGRTITRLAIVGGGSRNRLLCQLTADATGCPVDAGPAEATCLGNAGVQLMAAGALRSVEEVRAVIGRTHPPVRYEPRDRAARDDAYGRFRELPLV